MKTSLLITFALLTGLTLSAQNGKKATAGNNPAIKSSKAPRIIDTDNGVYLGLQPRVNNTSAKVSSPPYPLVSATVNMFGWIVETSNVLSYNADLNAVTIFQRYDPDFNLAAAAGRSGYSTSFWTTDNGATWDHTVFYKNDSHYARYPSGAILNPIGNTNPALAHIVVSGPSTNAGGIWDGNYFASSLMDGSLGVGGVQTTNDQQWFGSATAGAGYHASFARYSSVENNGTVYIGANKEKNTAAATPTGLYGAAFLKGTLSGTAMVWTQDSIIDQWTKSGGEEDLGTPQIAFGPDKMTGYILINGNDSAITPMTGYKPMIWKTTDGGISWQRKNQGFDWSSLPPETWGNLLPVKHGVGSGSPSPAFRDVYGGEITVDINGKLHYVTAATPTYSLHHDSLTYIYSYDFGYTTCSDKPWIFDFVTDGTGAWNANFIDYLNTSKLGSDRANDTTADANPWIDATTPKLSGNNNIQVSRSADGTKIFYTWTDSDPVATPYNNLPSLKSMGYDVSSDLYTTTKSDDYTNTLSGFWYKYSADFAMDPSAAGAGNWRVPVIYVDSRDGSYNDGSTIDVYYADDIDFSSAEFTQAVKIIGVLCPTGIAENKTASDLISVYPNPSNGLFNIKTVSNNAQLEVFNLIGERVYSKSQLGSGVNTVNLSGFPKGTYVIKILSNNEIATKKIIISE